MSRIHCRLPNASTTINGVTFEPHPTGGMISEEIDEDRAAHFASIKGYKIVGDKKGGRPRRDAVQQGGDQTNGQTGDGLDGKEQTSTPAPAADGTTNQSTDTGTSDGQSDAQSNQ